MLRRLLLIFLVSSLIEDFLFNSFGNEKREIPWRSWNIYVFARVSICLTSKISKEIWQMVIWSENVFKGNLMLQFSWLEEFCYGKASGWWTLDKLQYENGLNNELSSLHTQFYQTATQNRTRVFPDSGLFIFLLQ